MLMLVVLAVHRHVWRGKG